MIPSGYVGDVGVNGESGECAVGGAGMEGYSDGLCGGGAAVAAEGGACAFRGGIRTFYTPINNRTKRSER